ncbi:MAG: hypothetical protein ABL890_05085 [Candidatus Peribacteraceae bacterium]
MPSPHPKLDVMVAVVGGFIASFLAFAATTVQRTDYLQGQLLAGDPELNKDLPTTLNTIHAAMDGNDPLLQAMGSYAWWIMVLIGAAIAAVIILKLMRQYA